MNWKSLLLLVIIFAVFYDEPLFWVIIIGIAALIGFGIYATVKEIKETHIVDKNSQKSASSSITRGVIGGAFFLIAVL